MARHFGESLITEPMRWQQLHTNLFPSLLAEKSSLIARYHCIGPIWTAGESWPLDPYLTHNILRQYYYPWIYRFPANSPPAGRELYLYKNPPYKESFVDKLDTGMNFGKRYLNMKRNIQSSSVDLKIRLIEN